MSRPTPPADATPRPTTPARAPSAGPVRRGGIRPGARPRWRTARALLPLAALAVAAPHAAVAQSTPTRVMIRVVAHDAKIVGSGVGGARIAVVDARTGAVLARGVQEGSTGSTGKIMREPRTRGSAVYDVDGAAGFLAELTLDEPTLVRIEAEGPLGTTHAIQQASRTVLLVPGKHVLGDGVVLELYGFTVELLEPTGDPSERAGGEIDVRARVTMLCGCPTEPGGLWDSNDYSIEARVVDAGGAILAEAPLAFAGVTSEYAGRIRVPEGEGLSLQVLAMDPGKGNFGMVALRFDEIGKGQSSER